MTTSLKIVFLLSLQQSAEISICILDVQVTYIKIFHGGYDTDTPVISRGGDYLSCTKTRSLVRSQYRLGGLDGDSNLILYKYFGSLIIIVRLINITSFIYYVRKDVIRKKITVYLLI